MRVMNVLGRFSHATQNVWAILCLAVRKFIRIGGSQQAGAFAFNALFSLFPFMVLLVTIASFFVDRDQAAKEVIAYMERYVPISGEMQHHIVRTITGVIEARKQVGAAAFLILVWSALQCFTTLISATNHAWGAAAYNWWRLPLKSLVFLAIMVSVVFIGVAVPVLAKMAKDWLFPGIDFDSWVYSLGSFFIPMVVMFLSLGLFYRLAPLRPTRVAEVWIPALCGTGLLQAAASLFVIYLKSFARLNMVYGAFGGIMALLLWIYLSGCVFIFGACLCAAGAEGHSASGTLKDNSIATDSDAKPGP